jgi:L-iditol 2-dehydrogenase
MNEPTTETMGAVTLVDDGAERRLETRRKPVPDPGHGEVRLAVRAAGVCGSDVGAWKGKSVYDFVETPRVLGHEYVGVVDALGAGVERVSVGDRVVERPLRACGGCRACRHGAEHVCENVEITGFHSHGGFAAFRTVPARALHPVPEGLPDRHAALAEPMAVAARATLDRVTVGPGDDVLVLGAGPMGAFSALIADHANADAVVGGLAADEDRFRILEESGVATANLESTTLPDVAGEVADGAFDVFVDATGSASVLEGGLDVVRPGGEAVVIGIPGEPMGVPAPSFVRSEKRVSGSYGARAADFERALGVLVGLGDRLDPAVARYDPADPEAAFRDFAAGAVVKPLFDTAALR